MLAKCSCKICNMFVAMDPIHCPLSFAVQGFIERSKVSFAKAHIIHTRA